MIKKILTLLLIVPALLTGCEDDKGNTDSPSETGVTPPEISVNCTSATDPSCGATSDGGEAYIGWTTDTCAGFTGSAISAVQEQAAVCDAGGCDVASAESWYDDETDEVVTAIPSSAQTAIAWLNFNDNGASDADGPGVGDVFCCVDGDGSDVDMTDAHCNVISP